MLFRNRRFGLPGSIGSERSNQRRESNAKLGYLSEMLWPKEESIISEASSKLAAGNIKLDPVVKARRQTRDAVASLDQR